jgi:hypothetical protein
MFGKHWTAAKAHVVDKRTTHQSVDGPSSYEFVVDVTTASGEVFRAKTGMPHIAMDFRDPSVGMTVGVEYDEKSRDVRWDKDDPQLSWKAYKKDRKSGFEDSLNAPPGSPIGGSSAQLAGGLDIAALLQSQGLTSDTTIVESTVVEMDADSPEAAAVRDAVLRALGGTPTPEA